MASTIGAMNIVDVAASSAAREGALTPIAAGAYRLLLTRIEGRVYAISQQCPHLGFSMARGTLSGSTVECPWHGSTFDCRTGKNLDWVCAFAGVPMPRWSHSLIALGKKPAPLRTFVVEERAGRLLVSLPGDE
jgi:nitrite reductase/ring-hydroxylating ferredoxin subunit